MQAKTIKPAEGYFLYTKAGAVAGIRTSCSSRCRKYTFAGERNNDPSTSFRNAVVSVIYKASGKVIGKIYINNANISYKLLLV